MLSLKGASLMHSRFLRWSRLLSPALAILAVSLAAPSAKAQQPPGAAAAINITGSWRFTLYETLTPPTGQFLALATFTEDGSFIGTAQGDGQPNGPTEGPAHGSWQRTGLNNLVTFMSIWRQPDGSLFGLFTVKMTLTLDPRTGELKGPWSATLRDPNKNIIFQLGGNVTAQRILVDTPE
jgi:hypothetical protein